MNALTIGRFALHSLQRAPVRSGLTALGVIVGVAAVVATTSIGAGAKERIQETLAKPESRTVYLSAMLPPTAKRRLGATLPPAEILRPIDYYTIRSEVPNTAAVSPRIYLQGARAQANGRATEVALEGIDVDGFTTVPRQLLEGALFNQMDVMRASNVCVISESLARALYPDDRRTSRTVRLNDTQFIVLGVVDDVPNTNPTFKTADLHVYVPFTSLLRRLDPTAQLIVSLQASSIDHVSLVQQSVSDVMEQHRRGRKAGFYTSNAFDSIKTYTDGSLTVAQLLAAVGAISLVVGGIGIMNIMLVSVTERTREIGLRMAIGTRCRDILSQFLLEAIALSLLGGCVGIGIGWAASWVITRMNDWPTTVTTASVLTALLCSLVVGVFFGYHPALRASQLSPVEALRTDA